MKRLERRPAVESDRDFVYDVKVATLRYAVEAAWGWDEDAQRELHDARFDSGGLEILLDGEERAGYLKIRREGDGLHLLSVFLLPPWQSQGFGTSIIQGLQREAVESGIPLRLRVLRANVRAHRLYERLGLVVVRTTSTHHEMRWLPAAGGEGLRPRR